MENGEFSRLRLYRTAVYFFIPIFPPTFILLFASQNSNYLTVLLSASFGALTQKGAFPVNRKAPARQNKSGSSEKRVSQKLGGTDERNHHKTATKRPKDRTKWNGTTPRSAEYRIELSHKLFARIRANDGETGRPNVCRTWPTRPHRWRGARNPEVRKATSYK